MAGVTVERFWQLTPAEILIEIEAWQTRQEYWDYRVGLICTVIAEPNRDKDRRPKPFTPFDFMPTKIKQNRKEQTVQEQLEIIKILNAAMGGEMVVS